jgi:hypothetical protein
VAIGDEPALQVNARKTGHLQIGNQTRGLSEACGLQETLCGLEGRYIVPKHSIRSRIDCLTKSSSTTIEIMALPNVRSQSVNCEKSKWVLLYECNNIMAFEII